MKIRVTVTVEIDKDEWMLAYGTAPEEVRQDVKQYIANGVTGAPDAPITVLDWN